MLLIAHWDLGYAGECVRGGHARAHAHAQVKGLMLEAIWWLCRSEGWDAPERWAMGDGQDDALHRCWYLAYAMERQLCGGNANMNCGFPCGPIIL